jgi:prepilin-type N-terminal cleavage/methylation domain-containing protein
VTGGAVFQGGLLRPVPGWILLWIALLWRCGRVQRKRDFTLLELMMVVVILAILAGAAVPIYRSMVSRSYEAEILAALGEVKRASAQYKMQTQSWPSSISDLTEAGLIGAADFEHMNYVYHEGPGNTELSVDGEGGVVWTYDAEHNDKLPDDWQLASIAIRADGEVVRSTE